MPATQQVQTPVSLSQAFDGTPDGFEAIQDGRISGTVSQNGGAMAANGIEAAVKLLKGETLDTTEIVTDNTWIDSSNVKDYE